MNFSTLTFTLIFIFFTSVLTMKESADDEVFFGKASYYANNFEGKKTAFGEVFRNSQLTAAHRSFEHNTMLEVVNLKNGKNVVVRVNDRGPHVKNFVLDISQAAARKLGMISAGIGNVKIRVVGKDGELFESEQDLLSDSQKLQGD